jgi:hypothetical protein
MGREGYGANAYGGASSDAPGKTTTSPLADALRAKAAEGDAGDLLGDIIKHGTARNGSVGEMLAPQTRDVSKDAYPSAHGQVKRGIDSGSPGAVVPTSTGASPMGDEQRRRAQALQRTE